MVSNRGKTLAYVFGGALVTFAVLALVTSLTVSAVVVGVVVSLFGLAVQMVSSWRPPRQPPDPEVVARDLAKSLNAQWTNEASQRGLEQHRVVRVTWSPTARPVVDGAPVAPASTVTFGGDGAMSSPFEQLIEELAAGYRAIESRRLVILGQPGTGKTVLALLLTLGLVRDRTEGTPVPVLLSASTWDPVVESMEDWFVRSLADAQFAGSPALPRLLLEQNLLLPVVDGLDEVPEAARREAVRRINRAIADDRPIVVTCRAAEYEDVIAGGAPALRRAPVIEVNPLEPDDVVEYLGRVAWPAEMSWEPVFAALRDTPDSPVALALSTPLTVWMTRTIYDRCGGDPAELLDAARFENRHAIEDYLHARIIEASFVEPRRRAAPGAPPHWSPEDAQRWLTYLARYLHAYRERDLAWWRMSDRLPPQVALFAVLVAGGSLLALVSALIAVTIVGASIETSLINSGLIGAAVAIAAGMSWSMSSGRRPTRLVLFSPGTARRVGTAFGRTLVPGLQMVLLATAAAVLFAAVASGSWTLEGVRAVSALIGGGTGLAVGVALVRAMDVWFSGPAESSREATALGLLREDFRAALFSAAACGVVVVLTWGPLIIVGAFLGDLVSQLLVEGPGAPGEPSWGERAGWGLSAWWASTTEDVVAILVIAGLVGALIALVVVLTRAWGRFTVARVALRASRRLPLRLLTFLSYAQEAGLLRQSGGQYQFRHASLQEQLISRLLTEPGAADAPSPRRLSAAWAAVVWLTVSAVLLVPTVSAKLPRDRSHTLTAGYAWAVDRVAVRPDGSVHILDHVGNLWTFGSTGLSRGWNALVDDDTEHWAFSPDGRYLAAVRRGTTALWDADRAKPVSGPLADLTRDARAVAFGADGESVAVLGRDGAVRLWRRDSIWHSDSASTSGEQPPRPTVVRQPAVRPCAEPAVPGERVRAAEGMALSPDGRSVAVSCGTFVRLYDLTTGKRTRQIVLRGVGGEYRDLLLLAFSRHGDVLVGSVHDVDLKLWDPATGKTVGHSIDDAQVVAASPLADLVVTGDEDGVIQRWSTRTGLRIGAPLVGHTDGIRQLAVSVDGRWLVSTSDDDTIRRWDLEVTP
ncbi:NACHT and WD40 repeat domain-containing protein [Cryptosporangium aurantiacum]|uniref:WD40 repeat n=1 Tax=Cryptosporangium aurantiacum TaxID=134849 RepID=A0A1M7RLC1_9ACTN|nr:NACHT domain-containing protein [Cryptosporangium aurantiacum]SHN47054.1 WD40 repeat [Cryptosporangium aurantiacum]